MSEFPNKGSAWDVLQRVARERGFKVEWEDREFSDGYRMATVRLLTLDDVVLSWSGVLARRIDEGTRCRLSRDVLANWALDRLGVEP